MYKFIFKLFGRGKGIREAGERFRDTWNLYSSLFSCLPHLDMV